MNGPSVLSPGAKQMMPPDDLPPSPHPDEARLDKLRLPPHSIEAEQSVLGGLLLDNAAWERASEALTAGDFYRHEHQLIFAAIQRLMSACKPADVITVFEQLQMAGQGDEVGGLGYLNALAQSVPSAANMSRYAEIVRERATLRTIIRAIREAEDAAFQNHDASKILDDAKVALGHIADQRKLTSQRMPLMGMNELREHSQSVSWLVKHVIPAESIGMLYGGSGTFKSFIALDAALHIAHGLPWMGRRTRQGCVIYIAAEGGAGLWSRIVAWHRARRLKWDDIPFHVIPVAVDLKADAWRIVEAAQAKGLSPSLVVIDTLSQTYSGEENSANEMAAYFRELGNRFRALWQCAVMLLHHSGHQATERPRGSSAIRANLDFMMGVFRDEKEMLATLTCAKQKDGDVFQDATFALSTHELGADEDGEQITSLVARHLSTAEDIQAAMQAECQAGRGGKKQLLLNLLQNGSKEADLRKAFFDQCGLDDAESRRRVYNRTKLWATKAGFMEVVDGYVITLKGLA